MNPAVTATVAAALFAAIAVPAKADSAMGITASMGKFTPSAITLHVGQTTTLQLASSEGVHYLKSDDLGLPLTTLSPGDVATVSVTPKKAGTYVLHCAMFCGPGHDDMTIIITVVP